MRRLILFRYGKAVPHDSAPDFERGLTARGDRESEAAGARLAADQIVPDLVLVSSSIRTRETWAAAARAFPKLAVRFERELYLAPADALLRRIRAVEDGVMTLMVIGHNPTLHDLAMDLTGHGDRYALARMRDGFPTAAFVVLDGSIDHWSDLAPRGARLDRFVTQRDDD